MGASGVAGSEGERELFQGQVAGDVGDPAADAPALALEGGAQSGIAMGLQPFVQPLDLVVPRGPVGIDDRTPEALDGQWLLSPEF